MEEEYKKLAERNGWTYSVSDNRPYFMKNGNYAVPGENTYQEDKEFLASIISEGSIEMARLIVTCWNNNIGVKGPCSGIEEYHDKHPFALHFTFVAGKDVIEPLVQNIQSLFPNFNYLCREQGDKIRFDINYVLENKTLTVEESDAIFRIFREQLELIIGNNKSY